MERRGFFGVLLCMLGLGKAPGATAESISSPGRDYAYYGVTFESRFFEIDGVRIEERIFMPNPENGMQKIGWARRSFDVMEIGGFRNPVVHYDLDKWQAKNNFDGFYFEWARKCRIEPKFQEYWSSPQFSNGG